MILFFQWRSIRKMPSTFIFSNKWTKIVDSLKYDFLLRILVLNLNGHLQHSGDLLFDTTNSTLYYEHWIHLLNCNNNYSHAAFYSYKVNMLLNHFTSARCDSEPLETRRNNLRVNMSCPIFPQENSTNKWRNIS